MNISLFYLIAFLSIFFSLLVIFSKNPVHSVLYLIITFFTFTIHYIILNAQFLAIVNFIVYMGAIMVLFLFVLMLLNLDKDSEPVKSNLIKIVGVVAGMCLLVTLIGSMKTVNINQPKAKIVVGQLKPVIQKQQEVVQNPRLGLVKNLGKVLFTDFLLPFEVSSILLLSAMVGAVLLAKREPRVT